MKYCREHYEEWCGSSRSTASSIAGIRGSSCRTSCCIRCGTSGNNAISEGVSVLVNDTQYYIHCDREHNET